MNVYSPNIEVAKFPNPEDRKHTEIVQESLEKAGLDEKLHESIYEILSLIEKESRFNEDSRKIAIATKKVLDYLEKRYSDDHPNLAFSEEQKKECGIAAILHDIGKAGPADASLAQREAVIRLFASEQIRNPAISVKNSVAKNFEAEEQDEILFLLNQCGIEQQMTMRQFWDLHAGWTHDILEKYPEGLNRRIRVIAASHHYHSGINPYDLPINELPNESKTIGAMEEYVDMIQGQILSAIDQYEANIRRSGANHEQAIDWVRKNLEKIIAKDENMKLICDAIDELGRKDMIFEASI